MNDSKRKTELMAGILTQYEGIIGNGLAVVTLTKKYSTYGDAAS